MVSYEEVRGASFSAAATTTVIGVALDVQQGSLLDSFPDHRPILWCTCVTEPCDCEGPIIWIGGGDVRAESPTDRRNKAGDELHEFKLDADATVLVESILRARAGALSSERRRSSRVGRS